MCSVPIQRSHSFKVEDSSPWACFDLIYFSENRGCSRLSVLLESVQESVRSCLGGSSGCWWKGRACEAGERQIQEGQDAILFLLPLRMSMLHHPFLTYIYEYSNMTFLECSSGFEILPGKNKKVVLMMQDDYLGFKIWFQRS